MVYQKEFFSRKGKMSLLLLALITGLGTGLGGCGRPETLTHIAPEPVSPVQKEASSEAPPASPSNKDEKGCSYFHFLQGRHAELAAEYEKALALYEKSLQCNPDSEFVLRKIPLLLLRLNRGDEAVLRLQQYLVRHPEDTISRMLLAKIYIRQGEHQKAAAQYRKIHQLDEKDTTSLLLLSELYLAENKYDMAKTALRDVLEADDRSYSAHLLLARLLVAEEDFAAGQRHYEQALDITWSEGLQLELADVLTKQKKYSQAVELYQEILHHDEQNEEAQVALIHLYLLQGKDRKAMDELQRLKKTIKNPEQAELTIIRLHTRWEEYDRAIELLEKFLRKYDRSEARYLLAALRFQKGQYEKALSVLEKIEPEAKEYEESVFLRVRTLKELNRHQEAVQLLESVLSREEERTPDLYILLAGIYQFIGQQNKGKDAFLRALKVYPEDEQVLYEYGLFLDYIGEQDAALKVMERLIEKNQDHAGALNYVGYTWADKKIHLAEALRYITRAVKLKPDNGYIRDSLGWVYYQQGEYEKARESLEMAVDLASDDPAILDHLAETYLALGQSGKAGEIWRKALDMYKEYKEENKPGGKGSEERESKRIQEKINRLEQGESK